MVDHDQKGIKTIGKGKVGDEVTGDLLEGARAGGRNGEEWGSGQMGVHLVLLAQGTATDVTADIRGKAWPPKFRGNQLASFENARMSSSGMIMVSSDDRVAESSICGNIDATLVSQDAGIIVPVGEARMEGGRDSARQSMEGIENQWVRGGGSTELIREGGVDEVDEEFIREQGDCFIVCVRCGDMIWPARQGVRSTEVFAWNVFECEVELRQIKQPSGLSTIQIVGLSEVSQVFVVRKDLDRGGGTEEVVAPGVEGSHHSKQLLVVDIIVVFCRAKRLG